MQILSPEEASQLSVKKSGGFNKKVSKNEAILQSIASLVRGQTLLVRKDEWEGKTKLGNIISSKKVKTKLDNRKFHVFTLQDNSGWLVALKENQ